MSITQSSRKGHRDKILLLVQFALLLAIEAIICFTPLGSLPALGPIVMTLSHIPVIVAAITLGTGAGAAMGFFFGLFSFLVWTFTPPSPLLAFVFTPAHSFGEVNGGVWSLIICFVPRILIGVVTGLLFKLFSKHLNNRVMVYGVSAVLGTLANTFGVLFGIYFFLGRPYAEALGIGYDALLALIGTSILTGGLPEAALAGLFGVLICYPLVRQLDKKPKGR